MIDGFIDKGNHRRQKVGEEKERRSVSESVLNVTLTLLFSGKLNDIQFISIRICNLETLNWYFHAN